MRSPAFPHIKKVRSCILIVDRLTNEPHSYTEKIIHLPRLARLLVNTDWFVQLRFQNKSANFQAKSFSHLPFAGVRKCLSLSPVKLIPSCTVTHTKVLTQLSFVRD